MESLNSRCSRDLLEGMNTSTMQLSLMVTSCSNRLVVDVIIISSIVHVCVCACMRAHACVCVFVCAYLHYVCVCMCVCV